MTARITDEQIAKQCSCDLQTGCGEGDAAGCDFCRTGDCYEPCPVFGGMCDPVCTLDLVTSGHCTCTTEQRVMTRKYWSALDGEVTP